VSNALQRVSHVEHVDVTFGELAIGEAFEWRDTAEIQHGPPGPEPMTKATATRYEWSKGYGTAEPHYPVRRVTT
jgi:hypothetical protein